MPRLDGKVAIISGGLGDIGRAIALAAASEGADVALGDLPDKEGETEILVEIERLGRRAVCDRLDVSHPEAVADWFERVSGKFGPPDLIIPCAATATTKSIRTLTPEEWTREIGVNLNGSFFMAQEGAQRLLAAKKPGRIVFIGSWVADVPHTYIPAYCAAKAGLRMLCRTMALDLAAEDILVNEVAPGYVNAGLSGQAFAEDPEMREKCLKNIPIGKFIEPEEVAAQVLHLCDPTNRHMTGTVLVMDGGSSQVNVSYEL